MDILEEFWSELTQGEIRFRDNLQFELKLEFYINPNVKNNIYKQEFYLFIPSSLQINKHTYSKDLFYLDETNLIRYKTPRISLRNLVRPDNIQSPLIRLQELIIHPKNDLSEVLDELKLLGNIFRTGLRDQTRVLLKQFESNPASDWQKHIENLCNDIQEARNQFLNMEESFFQTYQNPDLRDQWRYTNEFISNTINFYLTCLLQIIRDSGVKDIQYSEEQLCSLIIQEQNYRQKFDLIPNVKSGDSWANEAILHRLGLLNKYMLEALSLNINRQSLEEKHGYVLAPVAAGFAMLIYMILIVKSSIFAINSMPFIFLAVVFYILKDRVKEGVKTFYYREALRWFPDYSTEITRREGKTIGRLNENFSFIEENQLPPDILSTRVREFQEELPGLRRQETIMFYKREVMLYQQPTYLEKRRRELTTIFRFNIHHFLQKANNALQPNLILNPQTKDIVERLLPKIYPINIIIRNTYLTTHLKPTEEIKKFRVVIDKFGIKRVEQIPEEL